MLKRLNHVAIVVPDIKEASKVYKTNFNANISEQKSYPEHGVTVVFIELENTKIELKDPKKLEILMELILAFMKI